jgi:hypothetical protein
MDGKLILSEKTSYDIYAIKTKISDYLKDRKYFVTTQNDYLSFKLNPSVIASGNPGWNYRVFIVLKEGKIKLDKNNDSIEISWSAKLDSLYFIASCASIFIGFFAWLFIKSNFKISFIIGISVCILFILIGRLFIKDQIKNIIKKNTYFDY